MTIRFYGSSAGSCRCCWCRVAISAQPRSTGSAAEEPSRLIYLSDAAVPPLPPLREGIAGARTTRKLPGGDIFLDLLSQDGMMVDRDQGAVKSQVASRTAGVCRGKAKTC